MCIDNPAPPYSQKMRYRLTYLVLGVLLVATVALGVMFTPRGTPIVYPPPIEAITPKPNDSALLQAVVEIDMAPGYAAVIFVDGFRVPDTEITIVEATGVYRWAPSPLGAYLTEWSPGEHTVRVEWDSVSGPADVGVYQWTFRIQ